MTITAQTTLKTSHGAFSVHYHQSFWGSCLSFCMGNPTTEEPLLVRLHSACLFGEVFSSVVCDCGPQLDAALKLIALQQRGVLLYLFQEGRGIGLEEKIRCMNIQHQEHMSTVQAFAERGYDPDPRTYEVASTALDDLECFSMLWLMSNNPRKKSSLERSGYTVARMVSLAYTIRADARAELDCKHFHLNHAIDFPKSMLLTAVTFANHMARPKA